MICNECGKREASVHLVRSVNGHITEQHLCSQCAAKHSAQPAMGWLSPGDFFKSFMDMAHPGMLHTGLCKTCGTRLEDFREDGLLGCPDCYDAFYDQVIPVLRSTHGSTQHVGDAPKAPQKEEKSAADPAEELRRQMAKAIAAEDFEQAAKLRDRIRALEGGQG